MSQDSDILRRYLAAHEALDHAARTGDPVAFRDAERAFADVAQEYADDLERNGHSAPHGLREQIAYIRSL
jgi:hypothetical protein